MRSRLYQGRVEHHRSHPVDHRFEYAFYFYALDLDELPELDRALPLFGYNRLRAASIFDRDYLYHDNAPIREKLVRCLQEEGVSTPPARVILITSLRYLNYVFNPVSFFYCYTADDALLCIVAEVNNTYGERHFYVLKEPLSESKSDVVRFQAPKVFHVSPYNTIEGAYEFSFSRIGPEIDILIQLNQADKALFEARLYGREIQLTPVNHGVTMLKNPLIPHLNIPRIYWEALMLSFSKKLPFHSKPAPFSAKTIGPAKPSFLQHLARQAVYTHFKRIAHGHLRLREPNGAIQRFGTADADLNAQINIRDFQFFFRIMLSGEIGLGESYTAGEWDSPDLVALLSVLIQNRRHLSEGNWATSLLSDSWARIAHALRRNAITGSRANIADHYDLGNEFFKLFLDPTMAYSCAVFRSREESLEAAQQNKFQQIISKAAIGPNDHVLEIGCGWGGFALEVARSSGCRVTAVTLSKQQYRYVKETVSQQGLENQIEVRLEDYRHIKGHYDRIVSIEMLEAVGDRYLETFFKTCDRLLKPDGVVLIQTIINSDQLYPKLCKRSDWIKKHIFPGGQVPSLTAMTRGSSLVVHAIENIGDHYALTLDHWRRAVLDKTDQLAAMNLGPEFRRKWEYYLALCQAGFAMRAIRNFQMVLVREGGAYPQRPYKV